MGECVSLGAHSPTIFYIQMLVPNNNTRTLEKLGLRIEWTHAPSVPGPGARGMATCDTVTWWRINEGPWWRPRSEYRSMLRAYEAIDEAVTVEEVEAIIQGKQQYSQ